MGAANCWVLKVEIIGSNVAAYRGYYTYRTTVRGCKIHEGTCTPINGSQYGPGHGYGIWLSLGCSAGLVENNNIYHLSAPLIADGAISGNVLSYNICTTCIMLTTTGTGKLTACMELTVS